MVHEQEHHLGMGWVVEAAPVWVSSHHTQSCKLEKMLFFPCTPIFYLRIQRWKYTELFLNLEMISHFERSM